MCEECERVQGEKGKEQNASLQKVKKERGEKKKENSKNLKWGGERMKERVTRRTVEKKNQGGV